MKNKKNNAHINTYKKQNLLIDMSMCKPQTINVSKLQHINISNKNTFISKEMSDKMIYITDIC